MESNHKNKKILILAVLISLVILASPSFALAQESAGGGFFSQLLGGLFSLAGIALSPLLLIIGFIGYVVANLTGLLFALFGLLGGFAVNIQNFIVSPDNTIVQTGWTVVRDIANLGFVMAIIIIAFATVLRLEQYQTQKFLPKLIAAAIIVNFSLAIGAVFIDFSQILTNYFFSRAGGDNPFILFLGSLDPQRLLSAFNFSSFSQGVTQFGSAAINFALAPWFIALFNLMASFVILVGAAMLLVRFFYLSFLLIISPIVWLFWVIPGLTDQFSKWWHKFLQWIFFAPAFAFFFYLAIFSSLNAGKLFASARTSEGTALGLGLEANFASIFLNGIRMLLPIGMLIAGLIVSESMGIAGAKGAMGLLQKGGQWARGKATAWATRQAIRAGTAPLRGEKGRQFVEGLQKGEVGGRYSGIISALGGRQIGNVLSTLGVVQGENLIKRADEEQKGLSDKQLALRVATMSNDRRTAALTRLAKNKNLDMVPNMASYIKDPNNKTIFESYGKVKDYEDVEKTFSANTKMLNAQTDDEWNRAAHEFYSKFSKTDWNKTQFNDVFGPKSKFGLSDEDHERQKRAVAYGVIMNNPGDIRKVFVNVKSENIKKTGDVIRDVIPAIRNSGVDRAEAIASKAEEVLESTLAKRLMGELFDFAPPPGGATPA